MKLRSRLRKWRVTGRGFRRWLGRKVAVAGPYVLHLLALGLVAAGVWWFAHPGQALVVAGLGLAVLNEVWNDKPPSI